MKTTAMFALLALSASALLANAQDFGGPPPDGNQGPPGMGPGNGPEGRGHRRPPPNVLMDALDTNHDGIIDSNEIANASAALRKLDKNGDGRLTPDELRPQRPPRPGGNHRGPGPDNQNRPPRRDISRATGPGGPPGPDNRMPPPPDGPPPQQGGPPGN